MAEKKEKLTRMEKALREKTKKEWRKEKKQREQAEKRNARRPSTLRGLLMMAGIFVLLLICGFGILFFDLFSAKAAAGNLLGLQAAVSAQKEETLKQYTKELDDRAEELKVMQEELAQKEKSLNAREAAAVAAEEKYNQRLWELEKIQAQLEENSADISSVAKTIEGMEAEAAAGVFSQISDQGYAVTLLKHLKTSTQAAILENMDAKLAATLLQALKPKENTSENP